MSAPPATPTIGRTRRRCCARCGVRPWRHHPAWSPSTRGARSCRPAGARPCSSRRWHHVPTTRRSAAGGAAAPLGTTASAAAALVRADAAVDLHCILPAISVPTLLVRHAGDQVAGGAAIAEMADGIGGATSTSVDNPVHLVTIMAVRSSDDRRRVDPARDHAARAAVPVAGRPRPARRGGNQWPPRPRSLSGAHTAPPPGVREPGLEPGHLSILEPKSSASTNSATLATKQRLPRPRSRGDSSPRRSTARAETLLAPGIHRISSGGWPWLGHQPGQSTPPERADMNDLASLPRRAGGTPTAIPMVPEGP